jgi:hypothetical protein
MIQIKNIHQDEVLLDSLGKLFAVDEIVVVPENDLHNWSSNSQLIDLISQKKLEVLLSSQDGFSTAEQISILKRNQVDIINKDPDTEGVAVSFKFAPDGWKQQLFETEFTTSTPDSIHEKNWKNQDIGYSILKFYNAADEQITDNLDTLCTRTDYLWMPDHDYAIKSGFVTQKEIPTENIYVWALGGDIPEEFGGPIAVFAEGGLNLAFVDERERAGMNGVSASVLPYEHPQLGPGAGTNRIRFVFRHQPGFVHRVQIVLEIFVPL